MKTAYIFACAALMAASGMAEAAPLRADAAIIKPSFILIHDTCHEIPATHTADGERHYHRIHDNSGRWVCNTYYPTGDGTYVFAPFDPGAEIDMGGIGSQSEVWSESPSDQQGFGFQFRFGN